MKVQDIIRNMLDMIDQLDGEGSPVDQTPQGYCDDDLDRFKQIAGLHSAGDVSPLSNSPNEKYADIEAVTTHAGGGMNGPKNPHDLRVKDPSMYPNQQEF